jgi:hypothetical protein
MSHKLGLRTATVVAALSLGLVSQVVLAGTAGALTATKAELKNGQLRVEGRGAAPGGSVVIASSTTSVASARIDVNGGFKIQASNFSASDCKSPSRTSKRPPPPCLLPAAPRRLCRFRPARRRRPDPA